MESITSIIIKSFKINLDKLFVLYGKWLNTTFFVYLSLQFVVLCSFLIIPASLSFRPPPELPFAFSFTLTKAAPTDRNRSFYQSQVPSFSLSLAFYSLCYHWAKLDATTIKMCEWNAYAICMDPWNRRFSVCIYFSSIWHGALSWEAPPFHNGGSI